MIRKFQPQDTDQVMKIWLESSLDSHDFIPASYWQKNFVAVRDNYLPASTTYVWEEDGEIKAFASLMNEDKLGALFVDASARGKGIGKALIDCRRQLSHCFRNFLSRPAAIILYCFCHTRWRKETFIIYIYP